MTAGFFTAISPLPNSQIGLAVSCLFNTTTVIIGVAKNYVVQIYDITHKTSISINVNELLQFFAS